MQAVPRPVTSVLHGVPEEAMLLPSMGETSPGNQCHIDAMVHVIIARTNKICLATNRHFAAVVQSI